MCTKTDFFTAVRWEKKAEHTHERDEDAREDQVKDEVECAASDMQREHNERKLLWTAIVFYRLGIRTHIFFKFIKNKIIIKKKFRIDYFLETTRRFECKSRAGLRHFY